MSKIFILLFMIFCHVIDDYFIQSAGCLSFLKTKDFWKKEAPEELYKYDYVVALLMHGISWAFMIMIPIFIQYKFNVNGILLIFFIINWLIHSTTDHVKANIKAINLIADQIVHFVQIILTWYILIVI